MHSHSPSSFARSSLLCSRSAIRRRRAVRLQPRFDRAQLRVNLRQIGHEVLHDRHVRQRRDAHRAFHLIDRLQAGERVAAIDVHRAGAADPLPAGAAEGQVGSTSFLILISASSTIGPQASRSML